MIPGSAHWSLYRHGLTSAASSPFSSRGASPSEDYRTGQRPAGSSSGAERAADTGGQPPQQEPLLLGSSQHTFRTAGLHAFLPYSRSRAASPLASSASTDTCLDLSMPRASSSTGERGRAPPAAARGAPSPPASTEATAPSSAPTSAVAATVSGSAAGCSRTVPTTKAEREASKRSSIPVGIAVAWQRRQDSAADLAPKADASGQQPVPTTRNKPDMPGSGDGPPTLDQPGFLKANRIALEDSSPALDKPAPLPPSVVHFGLPLSLALPAESVIKANRSVTAKDLPREPIHDQLPQLHQPLGQSVMMKDPVMPHAQYPLPVDLPKISVSGADSSATVIVKTDDSTVSQATCLREKLDVAMQHAFEPTAVRDLSVISSSTVRNATASGIGAECVLTSNATSRKASTEEVAPANVSDPDNVARCSNTSPSHHGSSEDAAVVAKHSSFIAEENDDDVLETSGRVLRAARRDATKGSGIATDAKPTGVSTAAVAAVPGSTLRSKRRSKSSSKGKAPKKKKAKKSASDEIDYTVITYNGVKYHTLRDRELQALCKRLKERQRTLGRTVRSLASKISKLDVDMVDEFEASATENNDHDNDVQPFAGSSLSGGGVIRNAGDGLAGPAPAGPAAADGESPSAEALGTAECIGSSGSCPDSRKKKKKKKSSKNRKAADVHSPAVTSVLTNAAAAEGGHEVSIRCTASASIRVAAAAAAAAAAAEAVMAVDLRVSADDLVEGARLLVFIRGLPHEATVVCIEPPSVYGVLLVGQRSARPRVYARDDLLHDAYRDVQPTGVDVLRPGSRVCAYWSNQFGYLYPGVVTAIYNAEAAAAAAAAAPSPSAGSAAALGIPATGGGGQSSRSSRASTGSRSHVGAGTLPGAGPSPLVDIMFDDGDSGKFPLEQIRLLPADFPHTPVPHQQGYDDELSVVPVERRRSLSRATSAAAPALLPASSAGVRSPTSSSSDGLTPTKQREGGAAGRSQPVCSVTSVCTITSSTGGGVGADDGDVFEDSDDEPLQLYKAKRARESFLACDGDWEWSGPVTRRRESSSGGGQGRQRPREIKDFYKEIRRGDETLKVGDCAVFVRREEDKPPYVGKILSMWQGRRSHRMVVKVQWFYHPEEIQDISVRAATPDGGVKDLTGALFESEHVDENSVQTISHRCEVLPLVDYQKEGLHMRPLVELMEHTAFYVAGKYDAAHSQVVSLLNESGVAAAGN